MNKRTLLILILVIAVAGVVLWRPLFIGDEDEVPDLTDQDTPDFIAEGLRTRIFETDGRLAHQLFADRMEHFSLSGLTRLTNPEYVSFLSEAPETAGNQWEITAENGYFYNDESLLLETNVLIRNLSGQGYIQRIETQQLDIDLQAQLLYTEAPVTILGARFEMRGNGLQIDLEAQQVKLVEHVQTIYYPRRNNESD